MSAHSHLRAHRRDEAIILCPGQKRRHCNALGSYRRSVWHCAGDLWQQRAVTNSPLSHWNSPLWLCRLVAGDRGRVERLLCLPALDTPHTSINHTRPQHISKHSMSGQGKDQIPQHLTGLNSMQAIYWKVSVIHGMSPSRRRSQERLAIVHRGARWNISRATQKTLDQQQLVE